MNKFGEFKKTYTSENDRLILKEFDRLNGECYLDHAGATLYSQEQIENVSRDLTSNLYGNPHTTNIASKVTKDAIDIVRLRILDRFNTNSQEYSIIFTSGATAALKLVAECFDYANGSKKDIGVFAYLEDNHTSVLGMREYAKNVKVISHAQAYEVLSVNHAASGHDLRNTNSLFVYSAQCNFSGVKYPLSWVDSVKRGSLNRLTSENSKNWYVLLDAATFVPTNVLNLSKYKPDFIAISFYKMFGYPTGLGALLVKNSSRHVLVKKYYGGGTVQLAISVENVYIPRENFHERFEDGTLPFLSILAVGHGLKTIDRLNLNYYMISHHVFHLAQYLYRNLLVMHHSNGKLAVVLYCDTNYETSENQGGIVTFNLLRPDGTCIGYSEVSHAANLYKIHLRTGCFCNPGACQRHLRLSVADIYKHYEAGHICGDQNDLVDGYPTGCVRVSFGYMSMKEDADKLLYMIKDCFIQKPVTLKIPINWKNIGVNHSTSVKISKKHYASSNGDVLKGLNSKGTLEQIYLYPVKSCGAFRVRTTWNISSTGLQYDRQWMIVNSSGVCVTQKQIKDLHKIKPEINLESNTLYLKADGFDSIGIPLNSKLERRGTTEICQSKICGKIIQGWDCGDAVGNWLDAVLNSRGLRLLRQFESTVSPSHLENGTGETLKMSLANKAQYLLINIASIEWLRNKMGNDVSEDTDSTIQRFRPNFVINTKEAFIENRTKFFSVDKLYFEVTGKCVRCQMICVNQETGDISKEPLTVLSREKQGDISFGVYLKRESISTSSYVSVGSNVESHSE